MKLPRPPVSLVVAILRIGAGLLFFEHGAQKLLGWFGAHRVVLASQMGLAGVLELFGGAMIVAGILTRPVAVVLLGEMLYAFSTAHMPHGGWPIENGGELALLYALIFMVLAGYGPGTAAIDPKH